MISWKLALMALFGFNSLLPLQSAPKQESKPADAKPIQVQVQVKTGEAPKADAAKPAEAKPAVIVVEGKKVEALKAEAPKADKAVIIINKDKTEPAKPVAVKAATVVVEGQKIEAPKIVEGKPLNIVVEGKKIEAPKADDAKAKKSVIIIDTSEAPKAASSTTTTTSKTVTVTQVEAPKTDSTKKEEVKVGTFKVENIQGTPSVHTIRLEVLPSGEVKVHQGGAAPHKAHILMDVKPSTGGEPKVLMLKKDDLAKSGIAIAGPAAEAPKSVEARIISLPASEATKPGEVRVVAVAQAKENKPKADQPQKETTKTIELRIEIKGDGPPKVEILNSGQTKTEPKIVDVIRKVETRAIEVPKKVENKTGVTFTHSGDVKSTGTVTINGQPHTIQIPAGSLSTGVMKVVISEDGKAFKVESDGKAKTEIVELQRALRDADSAQAQALELRKKAEILRAEAMKEADEAKAQAFKKLESFKKLEGQNLGDIKDLEKHLQLKVQGEIKDLQKYLELKLVESKNKVQSEQDKLEQLNKRLERLEKAIDDLAKKIK